MQIRWLQTHVTGTFLVQKKKEKEKRKKKVRSIQMASQQTEWDRGAEDAASGEPRGHQPLV